MLALPVNQRILQFAFGEWISGRDLGFSDCNLLGIVHGHLSCIGSCNLKGLEEGRLYSDYTVLRWKWSRQNSRHRWTTGFSEIFDSLGLAIRLWYFSSNASMVGSLSAVSKHPIKCISLASRVASLIAVARKASGFMSSGR